MRSTFDQLLAAVEEVRMTILINCHGSAHIVQECRQMLVVEQRGGPEVVI
jgi:hypothetical protein